MLLEDRFTGEQRTLDGAFVVDGGHRLPEESLYLHRPGTPRAGDCVAPRTVHEAVLEARRSRWRSARPVSPSACRPAGTR